MDILLIVSILVAVAANVVIGMLWYSPLLFGKVWAQENGIDMENGPDKTRGTLITVTSAILKSIVLAIIISLPNIVSYLDVFWVCILVWIGFVVTVHMLELAWAGKKIKVFIVDVCHELISTLAMATALFYIK